MLGVEQVDCCLTVPSHRHEGLHACKKVWLLTCGRLLAVLQVHARSFALPDLQRSCKCNVRFILFSVGTVLPLNQDANNITWPLRFLTSSLHLAHFHSLCCVRMHCTVRYTLRLP